MHHYLGRTLQKLQTHKETALNSLKGPRMQQCQARGGERRAVAQDDCVRRRALYGLRAAFAPGTGLMGPRGHQPLLVAHPKQRQLRPAVEAPVLGPTQGTRHQLLSGVRRAQEYSCDGNAGRKSGPDIPGPTLTGSVHLGVTFPGGQATHRKQTLSTSACPRATEQHSPVNESTHGPLGQMANFLSMVL